jgi:hypothetical protein
MSGRSLPPWIVYTASQNLIKLTVYTGNYNITHALQIQLICRFFDSRFFLSSPKIPIVNIHPLRQ